MEPTGHDHYALPHPNQPGFWWYRPASSRDWEMVEAREFAPGRVCLYSCGKQWGGYSMGADYAVDALKGDWVAVGTAPSRDSFMRVGEWEQNLHRVASGGRVSIPQKEMPAHLEDLRAALAEVNRLRGSVRVTIAQIFSAEDGTKRIMSGMRNAFEVKTSRLLQAAQRLARTRNRLLVR